MSLLLFISDAVLQLSYISFLNSLKIMAHGSKNINKCYSIPVASALSNLTLEVLTYDQSGRRPSSQDVQMPFNSSWDCIALAYKHIFIDIT